MDMLKGAKYMSGLDLQSGYYQIQLAEEDRPKTAFRTPFGHYQWRVLAQGLCNSPATFQNAMNDMLRGSGMLGKTVLAYLDDLICWSKTEEEHKIILRNTFQLLRENTYFFKIIQVQILPNRNEILGFHYWGRWY